MGKSFDEQRTGISCSEWGNIHLNGDGKMRVNLMNSVGDGFEVLLAQLDNRCSLPTFVIRRL